MILLRLVAVAGAAIVPESELREGAEAVLVVSDAEGQTRAGETVRVIHRPGLAGEKELAIGITDGRGRVRWTPEVPGVARVRAGDESTVLRVIPARLDPATLVVLALLVAVGLGSLLYGLGERSAPRRSIR